jgi:hypothetical protein
VCVQCPPPPRHPVICSFIFHSFSSLWSRITYFEREKKTTFLWFESQIAPKAHILKVWSPDDRLWGGNWVLRALTYSMN